MHCFLLSLKNKQTAISSPSVLPAATNQRGGLAFFGLLSSENCRGNYVGMRGTYLFSYPVLCMI